MFYWLINLTLAFLSACGYAFLMQRQKKRLLAKHKAEKEKLISARRTYTKINEYYTKEEQRAHNLLKLYETTRSISGSLDMEEVARLFVDELGRIENIEEVKIIDDECSGRGWFCHKYTYGHKKPFYIGVKTKDRRIKSQLPYLFFQLNVFLDRAKLYRSLQKVSTTDFLTGIPNRRYFMQRYEEEFNRAKKMGLALSFLMIDIDYFKKINDNYGHIVGDVVLKKIAHSLSKNIREIDFIGRFGGEEFVCILLETAKSAAILAGSRLREKISRNPISAYDEKFNVSVSIGVASFPEDARDMNMLLETADKALYKAKNEGRNKVCFF